MLPSLAISLYDHAPDSSGLAMAATICILGGAATAGLTRNHRGNLGLRDAFKVVTLAWFLAGALGAFPYFLAAEMVPEQGADAAVLHGVAVQARTDGRPRLVAVARAARGLHG